MADTRVYIEENWHRIGVIVEMSEQDLAGVSLRAAILGCVVGSSLMLSCIVSFPQLPLYILFLCVFHFLEFWVTAKYNQKQVSIDCKQQEVCY